MSVQAMTWAYDQDVQPTGAKFVLVTLANHASSEGYCWPSQEELGRETGQDARTVRRHLGMLERAGLIRRERRANKFGHRRSDGYWLVGFGSLPDMLSASQPDTLPGRDESLPDILSEPTGQNEQFLPDKMPAAIVDEPSIEPSVNRHVAAKPPRRRDPIWDTQVELFGYTPTEGTPEHGRWNKAAGIWRRLDATPDEMRRAFGLYQQHFPSGARTALAIAGRAEHLLRGPTAASNGRHPTVEWRGYEREEDIA